MLPIDLDEFLSLEQVIGHGDQVVFGVLLVAYSKDDDKVAIDKGLDNHTPFILPYVFLYLQHHIRMAFLLDIDHNACKGYSNKEVCMDPYYSQMKERVDINDDFYCHNCAHFCSFVEYEHMDSESICMVLDQFAIIFSIVLLFFLFLLPCQNKLI